MAEVKAILLSRAPDIRLVDITHEVPAYDIEVGAFQLLRCYHRFPEGTYHLAVVDPGVGSERRCVYVRTRRFHFIGPDNGLLLWAVRAAEEADGAAAEVYEIPVRAGVPPTFHGRDVFAPFLAELIAGMDPPTESGSGLVGRPLPRARAEGDRVFGEVLAQDHYGNLVLSIPYEQFPSVREGRVADRSPVLRPVANYAAIPVGEYALLRGSHGFWEISCHAASAADRLGVKRGTEVWIIPE